LTDRSAATSERRTIGWYARAVVREVRAEQTLFSLPFVFVGAIASRSDRLGARTIVLMILAVAAARTLGMLLNRIIDATIDRLNPRTRDRYLASGTLSLTFAYALAAVCVAIYVFVAWLLGPLPLTLSPIPVILFVFYPYTKRFTPFCHFVLGVTLGLAPLAGWIAVSDRVTLVPFLFFAGVGLWVAGFDILYATMDIDFDRSHAIHSIPARWGLKTARAVAFACHLLAALCVIVATILSKMGPFAVAGSVLAALYLFALDMRYRNSLATPAVNAYLQANSYFSVIVFLGFLLEVVIS